MAGLTEGQKAAFAGYVQGLLANSATASNLNEKGLPVSRRVAELLTVQRGYAEAEAKYRVLVAQKREASDAANKALGALYDASSAIADQIVSTMGKDDNLSKEIRNWRDKMNLEAARGKEEKPA
jgi:hypothetical protein